MLNKIMYWTMIVAIVFVVLSLAMLWFDKRDVEMREGIAKYEQCVKREYGMTPIRWYQEHGMYPDCQI